MLLVKKREKNRSRFNKVGKMEHIGAPAHRVGQTQAQIQAGREMD